jgi:hypothetical protein
LQDVPFAKFNLRRYVAGPRWQWSRHGGADVCYVPGSFMQSNTGSYNALLTALRRHVPPGAAVSELYAGAGAIGLSIAAAVAGDGGAGGDGGGAGSVRCVESVAAAAETFEVSASRLAPEARARVSFEVARADQAVDRAVQDADVFIVDPPRKGIDKYTLAALTGSIGGGGEGSGSGGNAASGASATKKPISGPAGAGRKKRNRRRRKAKNEGGGSSATPTAAEVPDDMPPPPERLATLVYVSCGFASFERDADALLASGLWELAHAEGFNFFPGGDALEVLAVFRRRTGGGVSVEEV